MELESSSTSLARPEFRFTSLTLKRGFMKSSMSRILGLIGLGVGAAYIYRNIYLPYKYGTSSSSDPASASMSKEFLLDPRNGRINTSDDADEADKPPLIEVLSGPRGYYAPNISPFPFELETFLRLAKIDHSVNTSGVQQVAFPDQEKVTFYYIFRGNGESVSLAHGEGQEIIISKLCSMFNLNLEKDQSDIQKDKCSVVSSILKNKIAWGIALWRWVYDERKSLPRIAPITYNEFLKANIVTKLVKSASFIKGFGKHKQKEVIGSVIKNLSQLSVLLGDSRFFTGDSPGLVDCNAFSLLTQMIYCMPDSPFEKEIKRHSNLIAFVENMKAICWPDWDQVLSKPTYSKEINDSHDIRLDQLIPQDVNIDVLNEFIESKMKEGFKELSFSSHFGKEQTRIQHKHHSLPKDPEYTRSIVEIGRKIKAHLPLSAIDCVLWRFAFPRSSVIPKSEHSFSTSPGEHFKERILAIVEKVQTYEDHTPEENVIWNLILSQPGLIPIDQPYFIPDYEKELLLEIAGKLENDEELTLDQQLIWSLAFPQPSEGKNDSNEDPDTANNDPFQDFDKRRLVRIAKKFQTRQSLDSDEQIYWSLAFEVYKGTSPLRQLIEQKEQLENQLNYTNYAMPPLDDGYGYGYGYYNNAPDYPYNVFPQLKLISQPGMIHIQGPSSTQMPASGSASSSSSYSGRRSPHSSGSVSSQR